MKFLRSGWLVGALQLVFVIGVLAVAFLMVAALGNIQDERQPISGDIMGDEVIAVSIVSPRPETYAPKVELNGVVKAQASTNIAAQVGGRVIFVSDAFKPGGMVSKGDLLFRIDPDDFLLNVEAAEAEIAAANSSLQQLEAETDLAIDEWNALYPNEQITDLAARKPQLAAAKARLQAAQASKKQAELALSRTRVTAPADMRILSTTLSVGQVVAPNQSVGSGFPIEALEISVPVSQEELEILSPIVSREVAISETVGSPFLMTGEIVRKDASLDGRTRLATVFVRPDEPETLTVDDFVTVTVEGDSVTDALRIPKTAYSRREEVWVVVEGRLAPRQVTQIGETETHLIVRRFHVADGLVVMPPSNAHEGQQVTTRNEAGQ